MSSIPSDTPPPLAELVSYLFSRREAILNNWRTACEQDANLGKISSLSREEFNNLLPIVLDILEQRLLNQQPEADMGITASSHGLHRWKKALRLSDTLQELHHLSQTLYAELESYLKLVPTTDLRVLLLAQREIAQLMGEAMHGSVHKYDELQQLEAANRASALQLAIDQMTQISRQRGSLLRTSSHDLRSSFGIVNSAAYLLKTEGLSEQEREQYLDMLNRNLNNIQSMLSNLMDLSRLEAGEEVVSIEAVDAGQLLTELVEGAQSIASERGLKLLLDGPDALVVETDKVKLQRIIQNLMVNALKYTPTGFISVSWSQEGDARWTVSVQDSGPGLSSELTKLLVQQLKPTVDGTSALGPEHAEPVSVVPSDAHEIPPGPVLAKQKDPLNQGEGIGLQIVKRLSDLIHASVEIETEPKRGTLVRVRMPIHWEG
ncbi:sensor histidine kinase [Spirosoma utsteinense]|uniref:histidine kinase n=1 Tax=Spirosoma utsteinense TaxID=2585773 RepID=A0ABR6W6A7_9BACT|nr:HAMP domain-containing sensor histidine kinase [Spirosoma utsteinense]MBC3788282.1 signal transduction histidine kinase [Spirosoma utsteinense]MBC3792119.1 signal transduction histidine kinase [Spirosoma utsteinense]